MQLIKYIFRVAYNPRHQNGVSKPRFSAPAQIQFSIRHLPPGFQMPRSRKCHVVEMQTYFGYVTVFFHPEIHLRSQATVDLLAP